MAFIIPNSAAAAHSAQAAPDKVDFDNLVLGYGGSGVISGCGVTPSANLTVAIAGGTVIVGGTVVAVSGTTKTSGAADPTNPRFDLVCVDNTGTVTIQGGTASTVPTFPVIPANNIALASLYIAATQTVTGANEIIDKRVILLNTINVGVSTGGNTSNVSGLVSNQLVLQGGSNITLSGSTQSGSMTVVFVGATLPSSATTVSGVVSANVVGTNSQRYAVEDHQHSGIQTMSIWTAGPPIMNASAVLFQSSLMMFPVMLSQYASASAADFWQSVSVSSSSNSSFAANQSLLLGFYTNNAGTLSLASSGSQSYQFSNTSNNSLASLSGMRRFTIPVNVNATPGSYWMGALFASSSTNANWATFNIFGGNPYAILSGLTATGAGDFLGVQAASIQAVPGFGNAGATGALPASVAFSNISANIALGTLAPFAIMRNVTKA